MTDYSVTSLNLLNRGLQVLPDLSLYSNLQTLHCDVNELTSLENLPPNLQVLYCSNNQLTSLDNLPPNLQELYCSNNQLTSLYNLPSTLQIVWCSNNQLTRLDNLPLTLQELWCFNNPIYTTCRELYGFELSEKTIEQYNEILEKECCPLLK